jgi:hypothetical protein
MGRDDVEEDADVDRQGRNSVDEGHERLRVFAQVQGHAVSDEGADTALVEL